MTGLILEGRRRIKEQLKKLAPHEYAKTAFSYVERDTGREVWVQVPEQPDNPIKQVYIDPPTSPTDPKTVSRRTTSVRDLIAAGENSKVEFKSTARWNLHKKDKDAAIEQAIVKTVAGFLNAGGGTLLIGVNDQREAVGLENDYKFFKSREHDARDSYQNWLMDLFENAMGKPSLANISID